MQSISVGGDEAARCCKAKCLHDEGVRSFWWQVAKAGKDGCVCGMFAEKGALLWGTKNIREVIRAAAAGAIEVGGGGAGAKSGFVPLPPHCHKRKVRSGVLGVGKDLAFSTVWSLSFAFALHIRNVGWKLNTTHNYKFIYSDKPHRCCCCYAVKQERWWWWFDTLYCERGLARPLLLHS